MKILVTGGAGFIGSAVIRRALDQGCEIVNLAYGQTCTIRDLLAELCRTAGRSVEPLYAPARKGDVRHSLADVARAKSVIGFCPEVGFAEGIRRTYDWYRSQYS